MIQGLEHDLKATTRKELQALLFSTKEQQNILKEQTVYGV